MALSQHSYPAKTVFELHPWFKDLDDHLGAKNYDNGTWTPTITNMTGSPTVTATYQRFGKRCDFTVVLEGTQTLMAATISLPLEVIGDGGAYSYSLTDNSPVGIGVIDPINGDVVTLSNYWVTDETIIIHGSYEVEGI